MDNNFEDFLKQFKAIEASVEKRFMTTNATVAECLEDLTRQLIKIGGKPDCSLLWQVLDQKASEEQENHAN